MRRMPASTTRPSRCAAGARSAAWGRCCAKARAPKAPTSGS
ncbi:hypothetical protein L963_1192 [Leuconostoc mesenteroides subsp. cremoris T26]|nr:hypothetical protein L963_1192 [Leuconostoc mesenteroides subsp. cremoris T26]